MRGRPLKEDEFKRMIAAAKDVRPRDWQCWQYYLEGLWLSGLRLEESTVLSWQEDAEISVDQSGRRPRLRIYAEADKGQRDRLLPMTPDFAQFLLRTPTAERTGRVFRLVGLNTGKPITPKRVSRIVSAIGKEAGVVVNETEEKYGSAHDLRRSFGTRWASRVKPATLQLLMRHKSIETTLKYYVSQDADEVADQLWEQYGET
jgi:integrase